MSHRNINYYTKVFQPILRKLWVSNPVVETSDNHTKLMIDCGLIKNLSNGLYAFLPLGFRSLNKLINIVDIEMENIGAQKLLLPALTQSYLWKRTNRYQDNKSELFKVYDRRETEYILSPTYEESITHLISTFGTVPVKQLPLKFYQISSKWRDEKRSQAGFLRSREFIMKDLYTFDQSMAAAEESYDLVSKAYDKIFAKLGLPVMKCEGDAAPMGGSKSHEYHYKLSIGEDKVLVCEGCGYSINQSISNSTVCPSCSKTLNVNVTSEVGHTFLLNTKYSEPLDAMCFTDNKLQPLVMGSYGLGLSRMMAVSVYMLSSEAALRWPVHIAPYTVCVIPPKSNSKEEQAASECLKKVVEILGDLNIDTIIDDRTTYTIGKRLLNANITGYPYVIVLGMSTIKDPPQFEFHDSQNSTRKDITLDALIDRLKDIKMKISDNS